MSTRGIDVIGVMAFETRFRLHRKNESISKPDRRAGTWVRTLQQLDHPVVINSFVSPATSCCLRQSRMVFETTHSEVFVSFRVFRSRKKQTQKKPCHGLHHNRAEFTLGELSPSYIWVPCPVDRGPICEPTSPPFQSAPAIFHDLASHHSRHSRPRR